MMAATSTGGTTGTPGDVHTSAPAPDVDLFGEPVRPPASPALISITGRLVHDAIVRVQPCDHCHARPVLCLELDSVGASHNHVHVEQVFEATHRFAADTGALKLKRGMWVSVHAPLFGARLTLPNAASITALASPPKDQ